MAEQKGNHDEDVIYKKLDELVIKLDSFFDQKPQNNDSAQLRNAEWHQMVLNEDSIADEIYKQVSQIPHDSDFKTFDYIVSASRAKQIVGIKRLQYTQNPANIDLLLYMLINPSTRNFHQWHILLALDAMMKQCDLVQLNKIKKILSEYNVGDHTSRYSLKTSMILHINSCVTFSLNDIQIHINCK